MLLLSKLAHVRLLPRMSKSMNCDRFFLLLPLPVLNMWMKRRLGGGGGAEKNYPRVRGERLVDSDGAFSKWPATEKDVVIAINTLSSLPFYAVAGEWRDDRRDARRKRKKSLYTVTYNAT